MQMTNRINKRVFWERLLIILIVSIFFSFTINCTIDYFISKNAYTGKDFFYYIKVNLPIVSLSVLMNLVVIYYLNSIFSKGYIYIKVYLELFYILVLNFIQVILFHKLFETNSSLTDTIVYMIGNNHMFVNTVENLFAIVFTEFLIAKMKENEKEVMLDKFRIENERYKYNQLKSQINPHFLFNSLNGLSALIYENEIDKSVEYLDKLSDVYRYVLSNERKSSISLKEELDFIYNYIDILSIRYGRGLDVKFAIEDECLSKMIVPMSLQLLLENATKHNIASEDKILRVNIFSENNYLIIVNNLNPRKCDVASYGIGLNNLKEEYYLINKKVYISKTDKEFIVKIPLI